MGREKLAAIDTDCLTSAGVSCGGKSGHWLLCTVLHESVVVDIFCLVLLI